MKNLKRIMVSIDAIEHAGFLVEKALKLRNYTTAKMVFIQPIYDEMVEDVHLNFSSEEHDRIVQLLTDAESLKFKQLIKSVAGDEDWQSMAKWCKRSWEGILDTARRLDCDLIIKDAFIETRLNEIVHTPHDWNLLRYANLPVMMIKPKPWVENSNIVAAIDIFDPQKHKLNIHVLQYAGSLTEILGGELHVVNALPCLRNAVLEAHGIDAYLKMTKEVEAARNEYLKRLVEESRQECEELHVVVGVQSEAISRLVDSLDAECIIIGKVKPSVVDFMGTTAEQLLHCMNCDVVSVS